MQQKQSYEKKRTFVAPMTYSPFLQEIKKKISPQLQEDSRETKIMQEDNSLNAGPYPASDSAKTTGR